MNVEQGWPDRDIFVVVLLLNLYDNRSPVCLFHSKLERLKCHTLLQNQNFLVVVLQKQVVIVCFSFYVTICFIVVTSL